MSTTPTPPPRSPQGGQYFSTAPRGWTPQPGDAELAPAELLSVPGQTRDERTWRAVHIRVGGEWRTGVLTVWRQPPQSAVWVAHVRWGEDALWGWFVFDRERIRPVPDPESGPR